MPLPLLVVLMPLKLLIVFFMLLEPLVVILMHLRFLIMFMLLQLLVVFLTLQLLGLIYYPLNLFDFLPLQSIFSPEQDFLWILPLLLLLFRLIFLVPFSFFNFLLRVFSH